MSYLYLTSLLATLGCLSLIDRRWNLVFFKDSRRAAIAVALGVLIFSVWDLLGIHFGIFFIGQTQYLTGIRLAPNYPLEELLFLTLLCYVTLLVQHFWERRA